MIKSGFFIMLNMNGHPVPLVRGPADDGENPFDDDMVMLYPTEDEAEWAAMRNPLGAARGYEVFPWNIS